MPNIECHVREITPIEASSMLSRARNKSRFDSKQVAIYADDMKQQRWKLNGEPVIVSETGSLLSGRLRLAACEQADTSFKTLIINGIPDNKFDSIDALRRRQMSDVLSIRKEPYGRALSAALNVLWRYAHNDSINQSRKISIQALLDVLEKNPDVRTSLRLTKQLAPVFPHGMTAAMHYLFSCVDLQAATRFFALLAVEDEQASGPVALLRKQIVNSAASGGRRLQPQLIGLMIKSWEAFRHNRPMAQLRFVMGVDQFPQIQNLPTNLDIAGANLGDSSNSIPKDFKNEFESIAVGLETITPERANEILDLNDGNRGIASAVVAKYARDMKNGDWGINGQTIKIGRSGRLLDGQHRCAACIKAGISFEAVVIRGLDESVFDTFDLGARRSLSDILKDRGEGYTATLAASLRQLWIIQNGYVQQRTVSPTVTELLDLLATHPNLRESVKLSNRIREIVATSFGCALHYLFSRVDIELANEFMDRLADGSNLQSDSPILKLRNLLQKDRGSRSRKLLDQDKIALTIKAWNAVYSRRSMSTLKWQNSGDRIEPFPKIAGLSNNQTLQEAA